MTNSQRPKSINTNAEKQPWEPMRLKYVGRVAEIVQQGGGKLSATGGDPGEPRKPKGQEFR